MKLSQVLSILVMVLGGTSALGFEAMTYNVGLAYGYVDFARERRVELVRHLRESGVDLLCLQEVWSKEDQDYFAQELGYPYVAYGLIEQDFVSSSPACHWSDLFGEQGILSCIWSKCRSQSGSNFTDCTLNQCADEFKWLAANHKECSQTLSAQVGVSPLISIFRMLNPFSRPGRFAYKGSTGLMLLSKVPFSKQESFDMRSLSTTTHRGALLAQVHDGQREIFIGCTHLTADLKNVPYAGHHQSWELENVAQADALILKMDSFGASGPQLLMGDFNCGFLGRGLDAEFEKSCNRFIQHGYLDSDVSVGVNCSFCSDNSLTKSKTNVRIDHIFVKNLQGAKEFRSKVSMEQPIHLEIDGKPVSTYLSDHFGIRLNTEPTD